MCVDRHVEVREQFRGISLLTVSGDWSQAIGQVVSLLADPSWNPDPKGNNAQREAIFENLYYSLEGKGKGEKAFVIEKESCL